MDELKKIILCADDFGLNSGVSKGIIKLAAMQRLSAVSCMVNQSQFAVYAPSLLALKGNGTSLRKKHTLYVPRLVRGNQRSHSATGSLGQAEGRREKLEAAPLALKGNIQIGLHFNLTEGYFLSRPQQSCFNLNSLLIKTHLGLIDSGLIERELLAQYSAFVDIMGCLPDFIDGHQHVHQFPIIRQILLKHYSVDMREHGTYIRSTYPAYSLPQYGFKSQVLAWAGGRTLIAQLEQQGIAHNPSFSGIYDFKSGTDYRSLFRLWLAGVGDNALLMCHPGEGMDSGDAIAACRLQEIQYFQSEFFVQDLQEFCCALI